MRRSWLRPLALGAAGVILLTLAVTQLVIPGTLEAEVEERLEERGGSAEVELSGFPALRLLGKHGSEVRIRGEDLEFDLSQRTDAFGNLDGFGAVDIELAGTRAGPFLSRDFELKREDRDGVYRLRLDASASPREVLDYAARQFGGILGGLVADLAPRERNLERQVPVHLDVRVESQDGNARVVSGGGTVAGFPIGPLAEAVANAVVARL